MAMKRKIKYKINIKKLWFDAHYVGQKRMKRSENKIGKDVSDYNKRNEIKMAAASTFQQT